MLAPSSLTYLDQSNQFTVVLENHGGGPVNLQPGQTLGRVEEVEVCLQDQSQDDGNTDESLPKVSTLFVDTVTKDNAVNVIGKIDDDEQKRLMGIMESLTVHKCNLSPEQATLLMNLVEEY